MDEYPQKKERAMNRRDFLSATGAIVGVTILHSNAGAQVQKSGFRTITYNVLACKGYPQTDGNRELLKRVRPQMTRRIAQELTLYQPDMVTFQESPSEEMVAEIAEAMGMHYTYFPGGFPGAVITRHDIVESENCPLIKGPRSEDLFTRHWGRAVLRVNGERLLIYSAHLHPSDDDIRAREVSEALAVMKEDIVDNRPMLFQGDLNHRPDGPEYVRWVEAGLIDMLDRKGDPTELTFPSTAPEKCIDYIWSNPALAKRRADARVLFEGQFRTNPADETSFALSDHLPVLGEFQG